MISWIVRQPCGQDTEDKEESRNAFHYPIEHSHRGYILTLVAVRSKQVDVASVEFS